MIFVKEIIPRKISGLTSFYVYANKYSKELISLIESFEVKYYFKKEQAWELSSIDLKNFLDSATLIDDIHLELLKDQPEILTDEQLPLTDEEISQYKFVPREHQIYAINYHLKKKRWLLLDSMGVGKTLEIIGAAEILKRRNIIEHCLIICGVNAIKENWLSEINKHSHFSGMILGKKVSKKGKVSYSSVAERAEIIKNPIEEFFIITNIETLRDDRVIDAINNSKNKFDMIAVDEIHRCSSKMSSQGKNLLKLTAPYLIAATGTLITNKPTSAYLPLVWTKNDHSILTTFRPQYEVKSEEQVIGYKNLDVLHEELETCMLRRTLKDVLGDALPSKIIEYEILELNSDHRSFYDEIERGVIDELDKIDLNPNNILALNIRLRQALVCPSLLSSSKISSSKVERCVQLAEDLLEQDEKVIILSFFVEPTKDLAERLKKYDPIVVSGQSNNSDLAKEFEEFRNSSKRNLLIGTHGKMGTGLSFPECKYMIMMDLPWTDAQFQQSCDRIYRLTSKNDVLIRVLEAKDTIDEKVHEIIDEKSDLQGYIVDGDENSLIRINQRFDLNERLRKLLFGLKRR